ncbi:Signal peptide peptidase [Dirofilaria immitis]
MDYIAFTARNIIILLSAMIIYAGCRRSYSIYFFERDAKKIVFLENESAVAVPLILSVLLIILYHSLKLSGDDMEEKIIEEKSFQSRTSNTSRQLAQKLSVKLDSISESTIENYEEMRTESNKDLLEKVKNEDGSSSEEYLVSGETPSDSSLKDVLEQLAKESEEVGENVDEAVINDGSRSFRRISLRRKSILSDHELAVERKQSEIYKKISQISFLPSVSEVVTLRNLSVNISKKSILNILARLITLHVPVWLGVIAVHITIIEIFDSKFYQMFYYHPRMKLLSIIIAILLGLFHEAKWTWVVNDVLGIVTSYVVIARTETASYFAGFLFLVGMILFDIFWSYCINLLTLVTTHSRSSVMLIIPLGKEKKFAKLSIIDIMVPGIFLNIVLKFAEMYDTGTFLLSFYAVLFGLFVTELIGLLRQKTTPAIVIPGIFAILASMLSVENPSDLWRFGIKH